MSEDDGRRGFLKRLGLGAVAAWAVGVGGLSSVFAQAGRQRELKAVSLSGFVKLPAAKPEVDCVGDVCVQGADVTIKCVAGCDGCDQCNSLCDQCNGCNACDHGCDPGCNTCNGCNGCDQCDMCNAMCNTCNQCDHGMDRCVVSCDSTCDGCNQGNNQCGVDIDKNGQSDQEQVRALELNIKALEDTLNKRKQALTRLRKG